MPSEETQKTNYKALVFTGLISLAVAVVGNLAVNKFSEEKLSLSYELTASETFGGSNGNIRISNIEISNKGSKSIDDIVLSATLQEGEIKEYKINGIPANSYAVDQKTNKLVLTSKYINPDEKFYLQLLLNNSKNADFLPLIDLRGRGVIGKQAVKDDKNTFISSTATAIGAITVFLTFLTMRRIRSKIYDKQIISSDIATTHDGDQRDVFSYILSIDGLIGDAKEIRFIDREISYWSISDHLVQKWIDSKDNEIILKGADALKKLIDYASIADDSITLIKTGIARLYVAAGQSNLAETLIKELQSKDSATIKKRLSQAGLVKNA